MLCVLEFIGIHNSFGYKVGEHVIIMRMSFTLLGNADDSN